MLRSLYLSGSLCAVIGVLSACSASRPPSTAAGKQDVGPPAQIVRTEPPEYRHIPQGAWLNASKPSTSQSNAAKTNGSAFEGVMPLEPMTITGTPANPPEVEESESAEQSEDQ